MRPDCSLGVKRWVLWAITHCRDPVELLGQSNPVDSPCRGFRNPRWKLRHAKRSTPSASRFGSIGRSIQCESEFVTACRKSARTYLKRSITLPLSSFLRYKPSIISMEEQSDFPI